MITSCRFDNRLPGLSYSFNTDVAPLHDFDVVVQERNATDRNKGQQHGVWPTYSYMGGMEIHIEGDLLADDSDDFVVKKIALINALRPDPNLPVTDRSHGTFVVRFDNTTEAWKTDVIMTAFSAPRAD